MKVRDFTLRRILVTGGAGFIGSAFIRHLHRHLPQVELVNLDKLTYAGNLANLAGIEDHYRFVKGDIKDRDVVERSLDGVDVVVNFAAETHVDRSIQEAGEFILTDVYGVYNLLECVRANSGIKLFIHISTDEVYGSIASGSFAEDAPLNPSSPYAASKTGGDRLAYAYHRTYGVPVIVVRPCNNYGPFQYPEKLIPLFILNAIQDKPLPLYGDGLNRRDWLFVEDTARGVLAVMERGELGQAYNMGADQEATNRQITANILALLGKPESLIQPVQDRLGHDFRYSISWKKLRCLGWEPQVLLPDGLKRTVDWYVANRTWWQDVIRKREYVEHIRKSYV